MIYSRCSGCDQAPKCRLTLSIFENELSVLKVNRFNQLHRKKIEFSGVLSFLKDYTYDSHMGLLHS